MTKSDKWELTLDAIGNQYVHILYDKSGYDDAKKYTPTDWLAKHLPHFSHPWTFSTDRDSHQAPVVLDARCFGNEFELMPTNQHLGFHVVEMDFEHDRDKFAKCLAVFDQCCYLYHLPVHGIQLPDKFFGVQTHRF